MTYGPASKSDLSSERRPSPNFGPGHFATPPESFAVILVLIHL
jgi:hypothetical protein